MAQDRFTKIVLTLLTAGVWALALAQIGTPAVVAEAATAVVTTDVVTVAAVTAHASPEAASGEAAAIGAPFATHPLRWYMPLVLHVVDNDVVECQTTIGVINPNTSSVDVEIEFINEVGSVLTTQSSTIVAGGLYGADTVDLTQYPNTGTFEMDGHAKIYASHPNVLPVHYIDCQFGDVSMMPLAVGATLDLFKVGLPNPGEMPRRGRGER